MGRRDTLSFHESSILEHGIFQKCYDCKNYVALSSRHKDIGICTVYDIDFSGNNGNNPWRESCRNGYIQRKEEEPRTIRQIVKRR